MSYICCAKTINMKKLLFLTSIFCFYSFVAMSQKRHSDTCKVNPKSYKVILKEDAFQHVESKHVIPRELKQIEYCLINKHRHASEMVVISLDEKHELIIFPYSIIK